MFLLALLLLIPALAWRRMLVPSGQDCDILCMLRTAEGRARSPPSCAAKEGLHEER